MVIGLGVHREKSFLEGSHEGVIVYYAPGKTESYYYFRLMLQSRSCVSLRNWIFNFAKANYKGLKMFDPLLKNNQAEFWTPRQHPPAVFAQRKHRLRVKRWRSSMRSRSIATLISGVLYILDLIIGGEYGLCVSRRPDGKHLRSLASRFEVQTSSLLSYHHPTSIFHVKQRMLHSYDICIVLYKGPT